MSDPRRSQPERVGRRALVVVGEVEQQGDPADDQRVIALCALLEFHWPGRVMERPERRALYEGLRRAGISFNQATDAVQSLVAAGREFPPRAPQIVRAHREAMMLKEGQTPTIAPDRRIAERSTPTDAEIDAEVSMIDDPRVRELVERRVAAARAKRDGHIRA